MLRSEYGEPDGDTIYGALNDVENAYCAAVPTGAYLADLDQDPAAVAAAFLAGTGRALADVRGYAYEHRLVASQILGRPLHTEEQVHHRDGNRLNNAPENLEICESLADHRVRHRVTGKTRRLPGEENPTVQCACGCGECFERFDRNGRPRRFVPGHNTGTRKVGG